MNEQIKSIYQAILLETGFTRVEINTLLSNNMDKKLAQKILIKMLSRLVSQAEISQLMHIKQEDVKKVQMSELSSSETNMYNLVWKTYINLMNEEITSNNAISQPV